MFYVLTKTVIMRKTHLGAHHYEPRLVSIRTVFFDLRKPLLLDIIQGGFTCRAVPNQEEVCAWVREFAELLERLLTCEHTTSIYDTLQTANA